MTVDELSRLAYSGTPPDSAMPYEWLLYYRLKDIYSAVKDSKLTRTDGAKQKERAVNSYESEKGLYDRSVTLWKRVEPFAVQYAKDRTLEHADGLYEALYRMRPGLPERIKNSQNDKGGDRSICPD